MNFSNRRGESRPSGRLHPRCSVGTRGGCGAGWGPCACPREWRFRQGFMLTRWINSPGGGQAQGPLIHPTPPLVPTGRLTSLAPFGRQNSSGKVFPRNDGEPKRIVLYQYTSEAPIAWHCYVSSMTYPFSQNSGND